LRAVRFDFRVSARNSVPYQPMCFEPMSRSDELLSLSLRERLGEGGPKWKR